MSIQQSYNKWAVHYDGNENKTRDMEAIAIREMISGKFDSCLEIGCGTGKNTVYLAGICKHVTGVDLSEQMLSIAKTKISSENVSFIQSDITVAWDFKHTPFQLITCSLVLEHIEDLNLFFKKVSANLAAGGLIYLGELHPFKQYLGTKARFDEAEGLHIVECYTHHISDFISAGVGNGLSVNKVKEYFDDGCWSGDQQEPPINVRQKYFTDEQPKLKVPRILALVFEKT